MRIVQIHLFRSSISLPLMHISFAGSLLPLVHFFRWFTSSAGSLLPLVHFFRLFNSSAGSLLPLVHFFRWFTSSASSSHHVSSYTIHIPLLPSHLRAGREAPQLSSGLAQKQVPTGALYTGHRY